MDPDTLLAVRIVGKPAPWNGGEEQVWKEKLDQGLSRPTSMTISQGLLLDFRVSGPKAGDIDNLCEPVFQVLVNKKGWFDGKRPNILWYKASKSYTGEPGCDLAVLRSVPTSAVPSQATILFRGTFGAPLPTSGSDLKFANRVAGATIRAADVEHYAVELQFGGSELNIGDVSTGRVKNVLDCLYPLIGGAASGPEDWRVTHLHVEKGVQTVPLGAVRVTVYAATTEV